MGSTVRTLVTVLGMAQLLDETDLSNEQRDCLTTLHQSGEQLLSLINHILEFSQIQSGHAALVNNEFPIQGAVRDIVEYWHVAAQNKQVALTYETTVNFASTWIGDEKRIRQVVFHMVDNAVKFTNAGGAISVGMKSDYEEGYPGVRIDVRDTGVGMSPSERLHIFNDFMHANTEIRYRYGGCGLGLSICKKLVAAMGGKIDVSSQLGKGSTFSLWLPGLVVEKSAKTEMKETLLSPGFELCRQATRWTVSTCPNFSMSDEASNQVQIEKVHTSHPHPPTNTTVSRQMSRELRVLLVEDNTVNIKLMQKMLSRFHCRVDVAVNGLEAVARARESCWDVIFMDLVMPEMDGWAATQHIRAHDAETYIVALTGTSESSASERWERAFHASTTRT